MEDQEGDVWLALTPRFSSDDSLDSSINSAFEKKTLFAVNERREAKKELQVCRRNIERLLLHKYSNNNTIGLN